MLQSLKVSESGMIGQQQKLEIIANNLANADTPGFKRILTAFESIPPRGGLQAAGVSVDPEVEPALRPISPGTLLRMRTAIDLRAGGLRATGNPLDLAIDGDGFFVVRAAAGDRYTRNGSFTLDSEGRLSTRDGLPVLGEGGPIQIPPGAKVEIATDGTVRADGGEVGRLRLVRPNGRTAFSPEGGSRMRRAPAAPAPDPVEPETVRIQPGFLEQSNSNPVSELVQMITAQRIFEAGQRVLSTNDETLRKTVNELPKVG